MSRARKASLISVLLVLAACGRSHSGNDGHGIRILDPEGGDALAGAGAGGAAAGSPSIHSGGSTTARPLRVSSEARAEVAVALAQGPVVWIGQIRSFDRRTCALGEPMTFPVFEFNPDGHFERVVVIAEGDPDAGALAVRITIGDGTPPASPADLPPLGEGDPFWQCYSHFPTSGFEYTGLDPFLSDDRLRFDVAPNELWNPWCESREFGCDGPCETFPECHCASCEPRFPIQLCDAGNGPTCECENGACWANRAQRLPVDLVVTPEGLEGVSYAGELRLRRVMP